MGAGNNTLIIDACVEEFKQANQLQLPVGDVFELFVGIQVTKNQGLSAEEVSSAVVDGANDGGIDIFMPLLDDQPVLTLEDANEVAVTKQARLMLLVAQSKHEATFKETVLDKWITSMDAVLNLSMSEAELLQRFNSSLVEKILAFRAMLLQVTSKGGSVAISYIYASRANEFDPSPAFESKRRQLMERTKSLLSLAEVSIEVLSAKELFHRFQEDAPERRDLVFSGNPLAVQYKEGIGYVGLVPLKSLKNFISSDSGAIDERVFESNVRHFQGSVDVNSKIKKTVKDDLDRDFWWLNNGVTVVSPAATPLGNRLSISNPQIVNGLQTSYSVFSALEDADSDARCVLVKVIVSSDKSTVDKVISATNSQTAVGAASLRATDEVQREIEAFFETKGYFYDRRKNYYRSRGKPISKIFSIAYVAQAIHAIINRSPAPARARPTSLIKDELTYQSIFDSDRDFQSYLNCCLTVQAARTYVNSMADSSKRTVLANYVYHLAQISTAFAIGSAHYTFRDVAKLAPGRIQVALPQAADWLYDFIFKWMSSNPNSNPITLSKSTQFSDEIAPALHEQLNLAK